jgi:hypothetical protein
MRSGYFALAAVASCLAAPCAAQLAAGKSVQLSKVILDTETTPVKGKSKGGTLCIGYGDIKINKMKKTQDYEHYDGIFADKMKSLGYRVNSTSGDLFADDSDKNKGDYLIGATVRPDTVNLCSSVKGYKGDVTLFVEWQVYDRAAHRVVETATTTGQGSVIKFANDGLRSMLDDAFIASLVSFLDKGLLQKHVGTPTPPAVVAPATTVPATPPASTPGAPPDAVTL